jgi:Ala-tRNA(Pro) deacylase
MEQEDTYTRLIAFLDGHEMQYRLIDHAAEGRTEIVSPMRGNALSQAAKCIVLLGSTYVAFASPDIAERLAGSVAGTILPFSFNEELELIVDPSLFENDEMYFNAARLDRSMVLKTRDYIAVAKPRLGHIAKGTS